MKAQPAKRNGANRNGHAPSSTKQTTPATSYRQPERDLIAIRAYQIFEREGRREGQEVENWLKAEAELVAELNNG
jgi:hypothetical protein